MADIFISYARDDRDKIERLRKTLEAQGWSVWWDRNLTGGGEFSKEIETELNAAKAVIVAWSKQGADSPWVRDEASLAKKQNKLFPIRLDQEPPPLGFKQYHSFDFSRWHGAPNDEAFESLVGSLTKKLAGNGPAPITAAPASRFPNKQFLIAGGVVAVAVFVLITYSIMRLTSNDSPTLAAVPDPVVAEESSEANAQIGSMKPAANEAIGLGVIPFVNMSADTEQEYFADGLTEELLNWLANVQGLKVPGRTASFQFKTQAGDFAEIGARLGVEYLLEGSVRYSGDRLRITAQLIEANSGFHLWSETYDRKLDDIFAIQEDIARMVITELLGALPEGSWSNPTAIEADPIAHQHYLAGRALWAARDVLPARAEFGRSIETDPDHWLAQAYFAVTSAAVFSWGMAGSEAANEARQAISVATKLRPGAPDVLFAEAWVTEFLAIENSDSIRAVAAALLEKAVAANPRHVEALHALARMKHELGEDKTALLERVLEIEPGMHTARWNLKRMYLLAGERDKALALADEAFVKFPTVPRWELAATAKQTGANDRLGVYLFGKPEQMIVSAWDHLAIAATLADLGAIEEAKHVLSKVKDTQVPEALVDVYLAILNDDPDKRVAAALATQQSSGGASRSRAMIGAALLAAGDAQGALEVVIAERPDLVKDAMPLNGVQQYSSFNDIETMVAAQAYDAIGEQDKARDIWTALKAYVEKHQFAGFIKYQSIARATVHANLGEIDAALDQLEEAYDEGFRYLYSFGCSNCINNDLIRPGGLLSSLHGRPRYEALLVRIRQDNARLLEEFNQEYGVLDRIRNEMKTVDENSKDR